MNRLHKDKRTHILRCLVEGNTIRGTARMVGCKMNTVMKLLVEAGDRAGEMLRDVFRTFESDHLQLDEVWTFCGMKKMTLKRRGLEKASPTQWSNWPQAGIGSGERASAPFSGSFSDCRLLHGYFFGVHEVERVQPGV